MNDKSTNAPRTGRNHAKIFLRFILNELRLAGREFWFDLKNFEWALFLFWTLAIGWIVGIAILCSQLILNSKSAVDGFCMPDDTFSTHPEDYKFWNTAGTFQITIGFGSYTFGMAKFIDICFDVVVGHGGQAILTFISYYVFKLYITSVMEVSPISYGTYKGIFFHESISFWGIINLITEFWRYQPLESVAITVWIILDSAFIIIFSTLASAMTGYKPNNEAFIKDTEGNYRNLKNLYQIDYVIHDSLRLKFTNSDLAAAYGTGANSEMRSNESSVTLAQPYILKRPQKLANCNFPGSSDAYHAIDCYLLPIISDYVAQYGFLGVNQTTSVFLTQNLPAPSLKISAYYINPEAPAIPGPTPQKLYGAEWIDNQVGPDGLRKPFSNSSNSAYTTIWNNETQIMGDFSKNAHCQPQIDGKYQWGFSFVLTFVCIMLLICWTIGTGLMWLKATLAMRHHDERKIATGYKAIIQLTTAMDNEFSKQEEDMRMMEETQIQSRIRQDLKGGSMVYGKEPHPEISFNIWDIPSFCIRWALKEKWWLLAITLTIPFVVVVFAMSPFLASFACGVLAGLVFARVFVRQRRSRCLMISFCILLGVILTAVAAPCKC